MSSMKRFCERDEFDNIPGSPFGRDLSGDDGTIRCVTNVDGVLKFKPYKPLPDTSPPFDVSRLSPTTRAIYEKCKAAFKAPVFPRDFSDAVVMAGITL